MGSVPASDKQVCTDFTCVPLADYILLMTSQLEVLKHIGHANFDDNRSAELKRIYHLLLFGVMFE